MIFLLLCSYLDHVNKGLDFLTMVSAGQLQHEEYELIMKKNADHIGAWQTQHSATT